MATNPLNNLKIWDQVKFKDWKSYIIKTNEDINYIKNHYIKLWVESINQDWKIKYIKYIDKPVDIPKQETFDKTKPKVEDILVEDTPDVNKATSQNTQSKVWNVNLKDTLKEAEEKKKTVFKEVQDKAKEEMYSKQKDIKTEAPKSNISPEEAADKVDDMKDVESKMDNLAWKADKVDPKDIKNTVSDIKKELKWTNKVTSKLKEAMNLIKKIPWWWKIIKWAVLAKNLARNPLTWVIIWLSEWLVDARWEELWNQDRATAAKAINIIKDIWQKSVINSISWFVDFWWQAWAWITWNIVDGYNNLFKSPKELAEIWDVSDQAIAEWNETKWKWIRNAQAKWLVNVDKQLYWEEKSKETLKEYRDELDLDEKWNKQPEIVDMVPEDTDKPKEEVPEVKPVVDTPKTNATDYLNNKTTTNTPVDTYKWREVKRDDKGNIISFKSLKTWEFVDVWSLNKWVDPKKQMSWKDIIDQWSKQYQDMKTSIKWEFEWLKPEEIEIKKEKLKKKVFDPWTWFKSWEDILED